MNKSALSKVSPMNSLGIAQANAEAAAKELRLAQINMEKAQQRLADANEAQDIAQRALVAEVASIRNATRVVPLDLR